jgi:hypothetical protein
LGVPTDGMLQKFTTSWTKSIFSGVNGAPIGIVESLEVEIGEIELSRESIEDDKFESDDSVSESVDEEIESSEERPGILDEKVTHEDNTKIGRRKK